MSYPDIVTLLNKLGSADFASVEPVDDKQRLRVGIGETKAHPFALCEQHDIINTMRAALAVGNIEDVFKVDVAEMILVELRNLRDALTGNYATDAEANYRRCGEIEAALRHFRETQACSSGVIHD